LSDAATPASAKEFTYNPDGTFAGKVIVVLQIRREPDDTLTTTAVRSFYTIHL